MLLSIPYPNLGVLLSFLNFFTSSNKNLKILLNISPCSMCYLCAHSCVVWLCQGLVMKEPEH